MTHYEELWLIAFIKTQLSEVTLGLILLWGLKNIRSRGAFIIDSPALSTSSISSQASLVSLSVILFTASTLTHPPLWFVLPELMREFGVQSYLIYVVIGEALVTLVEAYWYYTILRDPLALSWRDALLFSLTLNAASVVLGLLL